MRTALYKLWGDLAATPGRFAMMIIAIALCSAAVIAMLFTYKVLTREMQSNYLGTNPAAAHILINTQGEIDESAKALLALRNFPLVTGAELGEKVYFQVEVAPKEFVTALIFIADDPRSLHINKPQLDQGGWPAEGEILLERKALGVAKLDVGNSIKLHGKTSAHPLKISGLVHDPALAPANTEHMIYGYISRATFQTLNEPVSSRYLKMAVAPENMNRPAIEKIAADAIKNIAEFAQVYEIHIPPPNLHPHQTQMITGLNMLLLFSLLAVFLGALLIATTMWGMLAQQVRQIGIMKTLGASSSQITALYLILVIAIGLIAVTIGFPLGIAAGRGLVNMTADSLNLKIIDTSLPLSLWVFNGAFCVGLPVFLAYFPIRRAANKSVRTALDDHGVTEANIKTSISFLSPLWAMILRNLSRRPGRLSFTLLLLAIAGATFLSSQNLLSSWSHLAIAAHEHRQYQIDISFPETQFTESIQVLVQQNPEIAHTEFFNRTSASASRADGLIIKEVYPDGGHGSLSLISLPIKTHSVSLNMQSGHWLQTTDEIVVNQMAYHQFFADKHIGDEIYLKVQNENRTFKLAGIIEEPLTGASLYAPLISNKVNSLRIQLHNTAPANLEQIASQLKLQFAQAGVPINNLVTENFRQQSGKGHLMIMVLILVMIAAAMCVVGLFSLATVMSANISERLREFAVMRSLGAENSTVFSLVINEAFLIALLSYLLSIPMAAVFSTLMARSLSHISLQPLGLAFSTKGLVVWFALIFLGAFSASLAPALHAMRFKLREVLNFI